LRELLGRYRTFVPAELPDFSAGQLASSRTTTCAVWSDFPASR
jgi:hypothetical protein